LSARRQARKTRVDDLIASARRWSAVAKKPKVKDRWREHWLCTLERLAEDRELCKKLDAVEPKAEGRMRRMNDGYGLVKEGLRSLDDWSARNHRPAAAHRQHYANLSTRARSLASALRAEDRMLIPMAQLTGNWIDANSLRIFVSQVTEAAGLRLSREEVSRIEVNRRLYIDEESGRPSAAYARVASSARACCREAISSYVSRRGIQ